MEYTTQMDAARKGIATPQMKIVAEKERMPLEKLMELVAKGRWPSAPTRPTPAWTPRAWAACCAPKST